jgi:hypothetical protein
MYIVTDTLRGTSRTADSPAEMIDALGAGVSITLDGRPLPWDARRARGFSAACAESAFAAVRATLDADTAAAVHDAITVAWKVAFGRIDDRVRADARVFMLTRYGAALLAQSDAACALIGAAAAALQADETLDAAAVAYWARRATGDPDAERARQAENLLVYLDDCPDPPDDFDFGEAATADAPVVAVEVDWL